MHRTNPVRSTRVSDRRQHTMKGQTYAEDPEYDEEKNLEEVPITVICNLKQYQFTTTIRIHGLFKISTGKYRGFEFEYWTTNR